MFESDQTCWSPTRHVGLRPDMLVSEEPFLSPMHGLQWFSDRAFGSPMRYVALNILDPFLKTIVNKHEF